MEILTFLNVGINQPPIFWNLSFLS